MDIDIEIQENFNLSKLEIKMGMFVNQVKLFIAKELTCRC